MNQYYITTLLQAIELCNSPDSNIRKPAEKQLEDLQQDTQFTLYALQILDDSTIPSSKKIMLAILFKNYVKKYWVENSDGYVIDKSIKRQIREVILSIMLKSDDSISKLLSDAISIISLNDFPIPWTSLYVELVSHVDKNNIPLLKRILDCANCIIRQYYGKDDSDENMLAVRYCIDQFAIYLYDYWDFLTTTLQANMNNTSLTVPIYECLCYITSIFSSLCWYELPDVFEDQIQNWMNAFMSIITNQTQGYQEEEFVEQLRANIVEILSIIPYKSDYVYTEYYQQINDIIWSILRNTSYLEDSRYRPLYVNGLKFLTSTIKNHTTNSYITDEVIATVIQNIIVPVLTCTEAREEDFEDNPYQYIQTILEGDASETVEQVCHELLFALQKEHMPLISQLTQAALSSVNSLYLQNPSQTWKQKEVIIILYIYAYSGFQTALQGTKTINSTYLNLDGFVSEIILPDLQAAEGVVFPALLIRELYFCLFYRHLLSKSVQYNVFASIQNLLTFVSVPIHLMASILFDKYLYLKDTVLGQCLFNNTNLAASLLPTLAILFQYINEPSITNMHYYYVKALTSLIIVSKQDILPYIQQILNSLCNTLSTFATNNDAYPPIFIHYIFEAMSALIKVTSIINLSSITDFYNYLFPSLSVMLSNTTNDVISYDLQILAYLLELDPSEQIRDGYTTLFPQLLSDSFWSSKSNIKPLIRLITAYAAHAPALVSSSIVSLLNIFRALFLKNTLRYDSLTIIETIFIYLPFDSFKQFLSQIWQMIFSYIDKTSSPTPKLCNFILYLYSIVAGLYGTEYTSNCLMNMYNADQYTTFMGVLLKHTALITEKNMKKTIIVGMTRLLYKEAYYTTESGLYILSLTIGSIINMHISTDQGLNFDTFVLSKTQDEEGDFEAQKEFSSYHALSIASPPIHDPFPSVLDIDSSILSCIKILCTSHHDRILKQITLMNNYVSSFDKDKVVEYYESAFRS